MIALEIGEESRTKRSFFPKIMTSLVTSETRPNNPPRKASKDPCNGWIE
jgi:hypothetical protein